MHIQKFEIALDLGGWETTIFIKGIGLVLRELSSVAVFREPTIEDHFKKASTQNLSDKANESVAEVGTKGELATIVQANEAEEKKATQRAIKRAKGDRQEGDVVAIGNDVRKIFGKTGETVSIKYPIVAGQVVDVELGGKMLNHFLSKLATIRVDDAVIKATVIIPLYISIDERE
ncbi:MAG: rod shape-determining protein, partial [Firmicutes bacterium]|nr:rod shape-determining protein [Bacillota bacterium]